MTDEQQPPDHPAVDRRLRAAGDRLRATAPSTVASTAPPARTDRSPSRRWMAVGGVVAAAAALVAVLVVLPESDESVRQVPATEPDPDGSPATSALTQATTMPTTVPTTGPTVDVVTVSEEGWDGAGGACLAVDGGPGACLTGAELAGGIDVLLTTGDALLLSLSPRGRPADEVAVELYDGDVCGAGADRLPDDRWVAVLSCGDSGPILRHLPDSPGNPTRYSIASPPFGGPVTLRAATGELADGVLAFEADYELGVPLTCLVLVGPERSGWAESCRAAAEAPWHRLALLGDSLYRVTEDEGLRVEVAAADMILWSHGCGEPVRELADALATAVPMPGTMIGAMACDGDRSAVTFGSVVLQAGPRDGGLAQLERSSSDRWELTDAGSGVEPDPWPLPLWLGDPTLLRAEDGHLPVVDVSDRYRELAGTADDPDLLTTQLQLALTDPDDSSNQPVASSWPADEAPAPFFQLHQGDVRDDAIQSERVVVWYHEWRDGWEVDRAFLVTGCRRGITDLDGEPTCT